jgi:hypothetical protein
MAVYWVFGQVSSELQSADLTVGNLEGAISDAPVPPNSVWLHLPLDTPAMLTEAGFDLLGLANNHALDAGPAGLAETRRLLQATELEPVEGLNVLREIDGLTIAFLAWNDLGAPDPEPLLASVRGARAIADVSWSWFTGAGVPTPPIPASVTSPAPCSTPAPTLWWVRTRMSFRICGSSSQWRRATARGSSPSALATSPSTRDGTTRGRASVFGCCSMRVVCARRRHCRR